MRERKASSYVGYKSVGWEKKVGIVHEESEIHMMVGKKRL